jgi:hypothetical protein
MILLFLKWNGEKHNFKWEEDLTFKAFQVSCVPCYQKLLEVGGKKNENLI